MGRLLTKKPSLFATLRHISSPPKGRKRSLAAIMNFYPVPPTIEAELYMRIPEALRCTGQESEWRGGFARPFQHIFLEGPVADADGNLFVVDVPYGRVLKITPAKEASVVAQWDGEPNGLAATADGLLLVADYKQVGLLLCRSLSQMHAPFSSLGAKAGQREETRKLGD